MLGARARAAEYNAAKNASARQASREAEEQKLPPKPAPISLGAFTKVAQPSRNKGAKSWIPLVFDDQPEPGSDEHAESRTPTKNRTTPSTGSRHSSGARSSSSFSRIRVNMPRSGIPSAPRAMAAREMQRIVMSSSRFQPVPQPQMQHHPLPSTQFLYNSPAYSAQQHVPMGYPAHLPASFPFFGFPPDQSLLWPEGPPRSVESTANRDSRDGARYIPMPTDMTPTKQEHKLRMISESLANPLASEHPDIVRQSPNFRLPILKPIRMRDPNTDQFEQSDEAASSVSSGVSDSLHRVGVDHNKSVDPEIQTTLEDHYQILIRQPRANYSNHPTDLRRFDSDISTATSSSMSRLPNPLLHQQSEADVSPTPMTAIPWKSTVTQPKLRVKENEEPYDRTSKMQKFVAAQQAFARTGKTVLNNQDRRTAAPITGSVDTTVDNDYDGPGPALTEDGAREPQSVTQPLIMPPPGLQRPQFSEYPAKYGGESAMPQAYHDLALRGRFGVDSPDWIELKTSSRQYRRKMLAEIKYVAARDSQTELAPLPLTSSYRRIAEADYWLHSDPRRSRGAREMIDAISEDYSARLHSATGGSESPWKDGSYDLHGGLVRGAGHILVNLSEHLVQDRNRPEYFNRTKQVPESALDPDSMSSGVRGITLFEDSSTETSGTSNRSQLVPKSTMTKDLHVPPKWSG